MARRLFLIVSILLVSCGLLKAQPSGQDKQAKVITIGLVGKSQLNPVFIAAYTGARVAAKELGEKHGVKVGIDWRTEQKEDPKKQAEAIDELVRAGVQGIAVACSEADILTPRINNAVDVGIPVVCYDSDAPKSKRFVSYGTDDAGFGGLLVKELAREMKGKGVVAILAGNRQAPNLQQRVRSVIDALKEYPSMELLANGVFYHEEIPEKAAEVVARAQKANPQIAGWAFVGGWPLFMKNGIRWKPGQVKVIACDALPSELAYLKSGHVQVLIAQNCFMWGYASVEFLLNKILHNQTPAKQFVAAPLELVTQANANDWSLKWKMWLFKEALNR